MAENPFQRRENQRGPIGLRVIGAMKLTTGLLLFAAWLGMFRLFQNDLGTQLEWAVRHFRLDANNLLYRMVVSWVSGLNRTNLRLIEAGTFFYALLHVVEGTGLILQKRWAGFLTIIATSSLVPVEVFEIVTKYSMVKLAVLVINLAVVVYVAVKLRQEQRELNKGQIAD